MSLAEIPFLSAAELAGLIRRKAVSPVEVVEALFARIHALDPKLNAYATLAEDSAREQAKQAEQAVVNGEPLGPLHGVPFSVKDLIDTAGVRTMRGSKLFERHVPAQDAPAVARLKQAGAILLGKTTTPELGCKGITESPVTGVSLNPWNLERTPGGSSGGAAAAVAAGLGPLALGTDGGGSIRAPAALCGIYGLKPSFGRIPSWPPGPVPSMLHLGPMTRTVADAALLLQASAGPDARDLHSLPPSGLDFSQATEGGIRGWRVAWVKTFGDVPLEAEVARLTGAAAAVFADELGAVVEDIDWEPGIPAEFSKLFWTAGLAAYLRDYLPAQADQLDPDVAKFLEPQPSATDYALRLRQRAEIAAHIADLFERYDLLLTPTLPLTAFPAGRKPPGFIEGRFLGASGLSAFIYPFNLTGQPAASVPCGLADNGLPVGLHIVGRRFDDAAVLRASAAFEAARPWAGAWPALAQP